MVGENGASVLHQHSALGTNCDKRSDSPLGKTSSGITAFSDNRGKTLHDTSAEVNAVLLLPSSHRPKGITPNSGRLTEQVLLRVIEDHLTPLAVHIEVIHHRLKEAHRVCFGGLAGINLALLAQHLADDGLVYPGSSGDLKDLLGL